jgi:hypothetical protein
LAKTSPRFSEGLLQPPQQGNYRLKVDENLARFLAAYTLEITQNQSA